MLAQPQAVADLSKHLCKQAIGRICSPPHTGSGKQTTVSDCSLLGAQAIAAVRTGWCQQHGNTNSQFWPALPA